VAKFVYYAPTHLLLTSVSWDHADLYPTEDEYFSAFEKLIKNMPHNSTLVACADNEGAARVLCDIELASLGRFARYGKALGADYVYHSVLHTKNGLDFKITHQGADFSIHSPMLGRFNAENITAAFAMAHVIGIEPQKIIDAMQDFKGIKRRLEKRFEGDATLLDCHAPTPEKAASVLESIREVYSKKIYAVYEPNIGGRQRASAHMYDQAFRDADAVIIPRLTKLKIAEGEAEQPIESEELAAIIGKTHANVKHIDDDSKLVEFLTAHAQKDDVIVFLGSHGFRGMIEETASRLK
jgi:UDP-N-acetylmuramate-alanine ligase